MRVAVFGARGRTGRLVVEELRKAGHTVVGVTRNGDPVGGATAARANSATGEGVLAGIEGCDAVVNVMASASGNPACSALARALMERDLRYLTVAGAAVDAPGDRKGFVDRLASALTRLLARAVVEDRQAELSSLQESRLRWTMLRPPRLVDGPATGQVKLAFDRPPSLQLRRADLASELARALTDDSLVGRAPFVGS